MTTTSTVNIVIWVLLGILMLMIIGFAFWWLYRIKYACCDPVVSAEPVVAEAAVSADAEISTSRADIEEEEDVEVDEYLGDADFYPDEVNDGSKLFTRAELNQMANEAFYF